MTYYEIYYHNNRYEIWKWVNNGYTCKCSFFKSYKTRKGAENWAAKQWYQVTWH